jgi:hypothetical protein
MRTPSSLRLDFGSIKRFENLFALLQRRQKKRKRKRKRKS